MTAKALSWAMNLIDVSPLAKLAAIFIGDSYQGDPEQIFDLSRLAENCCVPEGEVVASLEELTSHGVTNHIDDEGRISIYLPIDDPPEKSRAAGRIDRSHCFIYVIAAETRTKIGISKDATIRMENLQSWSPETLRLIWTGSGERHLIREIEQASHAALNHSRVAGEWFRVTPEAAISAVKIEMRKRGLKS